MRIVAGSLVRTNANLNIREGPSEDANRLGTIQKDVVTRTLADPVNKWVKVIVYGYSRESEPNVVYSEPSELSSIDAKRNTDTWLTVNIEGYVSVQYLTVVDGPE